MKVIHLGKSVDLDPRQLALENRIVRMLHKHPAGVRQSKLFILVSAGRVGKEIFKHALTHLLAGDEGEAILQCVPTERSNSVILRLTPWGEHQAIDLEETIMGRKDPVTQ